MQGFEQEPGPQPMFAAPQEQLDVRLLSELPQQQQETQMPQIPGLQRLPEDQAHLASGELTVLRKARGDQPAYLDSGWQLVGVHDDEEQERSYAHVVKGVEGTDSALRKTFWLDGDEWQAEVVDQNPAPELEIEGPDWLKKQHSKPLRPPEAEGSNQERLVVTFDDTVDDLGEAVVGENIELGVADVEPVTEAQANAEAETTTEDLVEPAGEVVPEEVADNQEEEQVKPTAAEIFDTPESLLAVLNDPDSDSELRQNLEGIVGAWQDIERFELTEGLWESTIKQQLAAVEVGADDSRRTLAGAVEATEELQTKLRRLANALDYRDTDEAQRIAGSMYRSGEMDDFVYKVRAALDNDDLLQGANRAGANTEEADEQIRRLSRADVARLSPEDAARLIDRVGPLVESDSDLIEVRALLVEQVEKATESQPDWRQRRDAISQVSSYARSGARMLPENLPAIRNQLDELQWGLQRGRYDEGEIRHLVARLQGLKDGLEQSMTMTLLAKTYAQEIR